MVTEVSLVVVLILANGLFAMAEMALVSARKSRLQERSDGGSTRARTALVLANNPNEFLSTVQIGITVVGTLASAVGGATIAGRLAEYLDQHRWIAPHGESVSLGIVVVAISYGSLILGELVPKRLALRSPEAVSMVLAPFMRALAYVTRPVVRFLSFSTELVLKLIPASKSTEGEVTEEEIKVLIDQAVDAGTLHHAEGEMLDRVFSLGDRRVNQIMTPRNRIVWLDATAGTEELLQTIRESHYTTFPVAEGNLGNVLGIIDVKDMLPGAITTQTLNVRDGLKPPLFVPETVPAIRLIAMFQTTKNDMALVVDEHGDIEGVVTSTDILETIVGDIPSPGQAEPPAAVRRDDGSWLVDGIMPLVEVKETLKLPALPEPENVTTIAGLVIAELGRIPAIGDVVELPGVRIEVLDMDGVRIDKVLVSLTDGGRGV